MPPYARAGNDFTIYIGETATLDGSVSNDPDDGPESLSFSWRFVSLPTESELTNEDISDSATESPFFTPDVIGTYVVELEVGDGQHYDFDNVAVETAMLGDFNGDSEVDRDDLNILLIHRNQPASECPECDLDGDGTITVLDARKLVLLCTRARCATE